MTVGSIVLALTMSTIPDAIATTMIRGHHSVREWKSRQLT